MMGSMRTDDATTTIPARHSSAENKILPEKQRLWLSPSVRVIRSEDGAALLDVKAGTCLTLNPTGLFIWDRLGCGQIEDEIVDALAEECSEPPDNVRVGYAQFVHKLLDYRLVGLTPDGFPGPDGRTSWFRRFLSRRRED